MKLLIVDDHAVVRAGLRLLLDDAKDIQEIYEAEDGETGYRSYQTHRPDVVLMDFSLGETSGIDCVTRIKTADPAARIMMLTIHDDAALVDMAMKAGALGYVTKSCDPADLLEGVRTVSLGKTYMGPDVAQKVAMSMIEGEANRVGNLTPREFEVMRLITAGKGRKEIAETLHISAKTVSGYVAQIKQKLGVNSTAELIKVATDLEKDPTLIQQLSRNQQNPDDPEPKS